MFLSIQFYVIYFSAKCGASDTNFSNWYELAFFCDFRSKVHFPLTISAWMLQEMSRIRGSSARVSRKKNSIRFNRRLFVCLIWRALPSFFTQGHSCSRWNLRKIKIMKINPFPLRCLKDTSWRVATDEITYLRINFLGVPLDIIKIPQVYMILIPVVILPHISTDGT